MGPHTEEELSEDAPTVQMGGDELAALLGEIVPEESVVDPPSLERPVASPQPDILARFPRPGAVPLPEPEAQQPVRWWVAAVAVAVAVVVLASAWIAQ